MSELIPTKADAEVAECLTAKRSFAMIAGAGSGKTTSLITALENIRNEYAADFRKNSQRVACITYTNRAVGVITTRLGHDDLYLVSTLHSFLWDEIKRFSRDIKEAIREHRIPQLIENARKKDNGGNSKEALKARARIASYEEELTKLDYVRDFKYNDSAFSEYSNGLLSHDDVIEVAGYLLASKAVFRKALGFRYPFIFVDEAQDTFQNIMAGLNLVGSGDGLPVIGYFGDPWQQIYENRAGNFEPPPQGKKITKTENFRCSESVIAFLNAFRGDVKQVAAGSNKGKQGSVLLTLVKAEEPEAPRKRYSEEQVERALQRFDTELDNWGWAGRDDIIKLFLVRQMIARRLGFFELNKLFTGNYASSRAQDDYETGNHFLLKPFLSSIWPLVSANKSENSRAVIDLLLSNSPTFEVRGRNSERSLREMVKLSNTLLSGLTEQWDSGTVRDVLNYCSKNSLVRFSDRLVEHLARDPRVEEYDADTHGEEKGDWLCDQFFGMGTAELQAYCDFIQENTAYSTQHGVKGEQYPNVLVVFDDVEAAWNRYSFTKMLAPNTSGEPTQGQLELSQKLAYVCFSRAEENLMILLFTLDPKGAKKELVGRKLLSEEQVKIAE
ncbi:MAG: UvrD-helicase domain-containing protein [Candidatus Zambryskibacteria bacterium]|nr:UvrD-helicase domain-containing protein [Candidatus Zambryskibacteria bacterium]